MRVALLVGMAAAFAGCSDDSEPVAPETVASETSEPGTSTTGPVDIGGRSLQLHCSGQGKPTLVLESGEGMSGSSINAIRGLYEDKHLVCSYDRANVGLSDTVATPRKADDLAKDLHQLLESADVPGPYVLIGHSAGGLLVQSYARAWPSEIAGVVALNPVPPWQRWSTLGFREMTPSERADESDYFAGANGESLDYRDISEAVADSPPPDVPFHLLISTIAQCHSPKDICGRSYPAYEQIMRGVAQQWSGGRFTEVEAGHELYLEALPAVRKAMDDVLSR